MSEKLSEFDHLYYDIQDVMDEYTKEMLIPIGLYDIYGGDNGMQISMYVAHMEYIRETLIKQLQSLLVKFPKREIVFSVTCPEDVDKWPIMGLYITKDLIIDGLLREYFPPEYQSITYEGSRPGDQYDTSTYDNFPLEFKPLLRRVEDVLAATISRKGLDRDWSHKVFSETATDYGLLIFASRGLMQPDVVADLQKVLSDFPDWTVLMVPDEVDIDDDRATCVEIRHGEIVDRLDRSRLPPEYADLHYPGARLAKPLRIPGFNSLLNDPVQMTTKPSTPCTTR